MPYSTYSLKAIIKDMEDVEWENVTKRFRELRIKCISEQDYISIISNIRHVSDADWPAQKERLQTAYARRRL